MSPIWLSIKVSLVAVSIVFVIGTLLAVLMLRLDFRGKSVVESLILVPLVLPPSVAGFLLLVLLGKYGPVGKVLDMMGIQVIFSWYAAVIASAVVALPLIYQSVKAALEQVQPELEQAARTLGASEATVLRTVTLPLAWPGFVAGTVLAFARSLGEFGATLMISGNIPGETQTIPLAIYTASQSGDLKYSGILVAILLVASFSMVFSLNLWKRRSVLWL
ncbi:MAG: molybdate ABC transporter permease subunit [Candidatus Aquicultor sp.]|nr:molybdate ABC transporter permease subunit [Candidatus Aquicultor sp.]